MYSKSVTVGLKKSAKLKNVLKKRYGPSKKQVKDWKMPTKSHTILLGLRTIRTWKELGQGDLE